jgi:hypothetical protein
VEGRRRRGGKRIAEGVKQRILRGKEREKGEGKGRGGYLNMSEMRSIVEASFSSWGKGRKGKYESLDNSGPSITRGRVKVEGSGTVFILFSRASAFLSTESSKAVLAATAVW